MKITTMRVPRGTYQNGAPSKPARTSEVKVLHDFTRVIDGLNCRFCVHESLRGDEDGDLVLSHYETGFQVVEFRARGDMASSAEQALTDVLKRVGPYKLRETLELTWINWRSNGCMTCQNTGFASMGGSCPVCHGSCDASNPNEDPTQKE